MYRGRACTHGAPIRKRPQMDLETRMIDLLRRKGSKAECYGVLYVTTSVVLPMYLQTFGQPNTGHNAMNAESIGIKTFISMAYERLIIHSPAAIIDHGTKSPGFPKI